jgi:hypothetical protein
VVLEKLSFFVRKEKNAFETGIFRKVTFARKVS